MADLIGFMTSIFATGLATIGTTDVTLGLTLAWSLILFLVIAVYRRVRGR